MHPPIVLYQHPRSHVRYFAGLLAIACLLSFGPGDTYAQGRASHVVVIGVDGLSPDGIQKADTPALDRLMRRGAHTFKARAVMPSSSSPNWASMVMGAGPEQHGVLSNDWEPHAIELEPVCKGSSGRYPTVFRALREQQSDAVIGVFHDWDGFGRLIEPDAPNVIRDGDGPDATTAEAIAYIRNEQPRLIFIHLDHVDHAGHEYGHGTPEYYASVEEADRLIGDVVQALADADLLDETFILITSDHGGLGKGHGGTSLDEMEIPWIIAGPGVRPGATLDVPVNTFDTAATVAYVLGIRQPDCWIARPIAAAFEN